MYIYIYIYICCVRCSWFCCFCWFVITGVIVTAMLLLCLRDFSSETLISAAVDAQPARRHVPCRPRVDGGRSGRRRGISLYNKGFPFIIRDFPL